MTIRRDYSRPFFSKRRRNTGRLWIIGFLCMCIGGLISFVTFNYDQLQLQALDAVGMAPTATPRANELAMQGMTVYSSGDVEGARDYLEQAAAMESTDIDYLYEYGRLLLETDQLEEAIAIGDRAIEVAPNDPRGYAIKGRALMYNDPAQAIQVTIRGQEADEFFAPLLAVQAVAYTNLGRYQEGQRQMLRALELDPNDPFVLRATYTPLVYTARYVEAAEYLEQAISINPNITAPYFELASLYRIQRAEIYQPEMSVALYRRILEIDPDNAKANLRLCQTFANVREADFSLAQPYCEEALEIDPEYGDAHMTLGRMQYLRRNYEGSIQSFERCVEYGSEAIECYYLRGLAHFWLNECEDAWDLLGQAQDLTQTQFVTEGVIQDIENGLYNVTQLCPGYANQSVPTAQPPTPIPPTPIGGF